MNTETTNPETTAEAAIARSISHTEIVTIDDEPGLRQVLRCLCTDSVEAERAEFWGADDDGQEWRVHVRI